MKERRQLRRRKGKNKNREIRLTVPKMCWMKDAVVFDRI